MQVSKQVLVWETKAAVSVRREDPQTLLEDRFGPLSETLLQRINKTDDPERLKQAFQQALRLQKLEELQL